MDRVKWPDASHKCPLSHKPCLLCTGTATRYPKRRDIAPPICVADLFYGSGNNVTRLEQPRVAAGQTFCRRKTAPTPPINYDHYHSPCILPWTCHPRMAGYIPHIQLRQLFHPGTHAIRSSARAQRRQGSPGRRIRHPSAQKYGSGFHPPERRTPPRGQPEQQPYHHARRNPGDERRNGHPAQRI